jgi:DNA ligase (NAD+)
MDIEKEIFELRKQIDQHNYNYYNLDNPLISDFEFDVLLKKLEKIEQENPQFWDNNSPTQRVGGTVTKKFDSVIHAHRMYSLDNCYSFSDLQEWEKRILKILEKQSVSYTCELKYDGVSISIEYKNGKLFQAITRGDGVQGDDITHNIRTIKTIPLQISEDKNPPAQFFVRGEVIFPLGSFHQLNSEREELGLETYANPRNTASGTLKLQNSREVANRKLACFPYGLIAKEGVFENHIDTLEKAKEMGFLVPPHAKVCHSLNEVESFIDNWSKERHTLDYETDGVVIKVNSINDQQSLGFTAKSPRWAVAYKFKTEQEETLLKEVTYQVGRTGAITPVANLVPVQLGGTTVKRASLHNADIIEKLDVRIGDSVLVEKGGEIIPKIVGVNLSKRPEDSVKLTYIKNCPSCGADLERKESEAKHYCPNENGCSPQIIGKMQHFISRKAMNIDSLGEETVALFYNQGLIKNIADLYSLTKEQILPLEGMAEKSANNIVAAIEKSKEKPFENVLYAIGIRFVGDTVAKILAKNVKSIDKLSISTKKELEQIEEIGEKIAESVVSFFQINENRTIINRLKSFGVNLNYQEPEGFKNKLDNKTFLFTGKLTAFTREEAHKMVEINGGKLISGISKNLDYLVVGENAGSKLAKAQKFEDIKIITENEFLELID